MSEVWSLKVSPSIDNFFHSWKSVCPQSLNKIFSLSRGLNSLSPLKQDLCRFSRFILTPDTILSRCQREIRIRGFHYCKKFYCTTTLRKIWTLLFRIFISYPYVLELYTSLPFVSVLEKFVNEESFSFQDRDRNTGRIGLKWPIQRFRNYEHEQRQIGKTYILLLTCLFNNRGDLPF